MVNRPSIGTLEILYVGRKIKIKTTETSLVVQWLRLRASTAGGTGSVPGWGTKISHAVWGSEKNLKI